MSDKERAEQALREARFRYDDKQGVWRRGNMNEATYAEVDVDFPGAASMHFPLADIPALLAPLAPPRVTAAPISNPQQALVSLADAPEKLREIAQWLGDEARRWHMYLTIPEEYREKAGEVLALASSLERQISSQSANTCAQGDTVTITMSQLEHAISGVVVAVHTPANMFTDEDKEVAEQALHMLMDRVRAALNNSTPERRD